ncbi:cytochrome aa3 quinol oxidase subunit IV [Salibacterium qingdaonense]|uniref:Quinol oxidase subunit 4 n=1 Tax=Salibacterium qingdaonense TaxID=266892 RepID=A0A1I4IMI6_9BACI|nr:cytochrome aa3 quinol oxidase subunit IV [Salibacterium qingdaonense]SFL55277.1 cytochrome aa3-600 menaquinol oxidase subunit 4 [Salibacterium qingdaonense]
MTEKAFSEHQEYFPWKQILGFCLSIILTVLALLVTFFMSYSRETTIVVIVALASFQLLVQLIMFMHLNELEKSFQIAVVSYGATVAIIVVAGTIWIMESGM